MSTNPKILLAIPCYNESVTIVKVIEDFKAVLPDVEIHVFDNNSSDGSGELAAKAGAKVHRVMQQGKGHVVRSILDKLYGDAVLMVDGDDTYFAEDAPQLLAPVLNGDVDMVVGDRLPSADDMSMVKLHQLGNRWIVRIINWMFSTRYKDVLSGYRAFSPRFLESVPVLTSGFEIETELTLQALAEGMSVVEVPVNYRARPDGSESKLHPWRDGYRIMLTAAIILRDRHPLRVWSIVGVFFGLLAIIAGVLRVANFFQPTGLPDSILSGLLLLLTPLSFISFGVGFTLNAINTRFLEFKQIYEGTITANKMTITDNAQRYQQLLEHVACNHCGHDDFTVIYPPNYDEARPDEIQDTFRSSGDEILLDQLVQCNNCGLQYLTPRLKSDVVIDGYSDGEDENFVSQAAGRERTFAQSLKLIERYVPAKGRILDVGTAGGSFLAVAQRKGWEVAGCEPNRWMAQWGKGHYDIDIVPGTIFDMALEDASFDVVTLWDVIEHTPDPTTVLEECRRVLKPGGLLVVNIPDIGSLVSRLMGRRWVFLLSIHLYYFTVQTLREMLKKTGFKMLLSRPHWQTLELGYILFRMEAYVRPIAKLGGHIVKALGLQHLQIPYWMGQTLAIAQKE